MLGGATLYSQLWDIKPPAIFWINALGLGLSGGSPVGVWVLCGLASIMSAVLFYRAARRAYGPSAAAIGTVFAVMYFNLWTFHVGCNRPATFLIVTELGCMGLYLKAITQSTKSTRMLFWTGVCGGLGLWFKQTAFAAPAAIFIHLLIARSGTGPANASRWKKVSQFVTGYIASVALLVIILALTSDSHWAWDANIETTLGSALSKGRDWGSHGPSRSPPSRRTSQPYRTSCSRCSPFRVRASAFSSR